MANQISGVIHEIRPAAPFQRQDGTQGWRQQIILDASRFDPQTGQKFENYPSIEINDKVKDLPQLGKGMRIKCDIAVEGRYYQDKQTNEWKHINSIRAYKVEVVAQAQPSMAAPQAAQASMAAQQMAAPQQYAQQAPQQQYAPQYAPPPQEQYPFPMP